ncbi:hypothetical protein [Lysobacter gummosus]
MDLLTGRESAAACESVKPPSRESRIGKAVAAWAATGRWVTSPG